MKPAAAQSRNLRELSIAQLKLTDSQRQAGYAVMIGALAQLVSPELWDRALNTTYGYIASCEVKLKTNGDGHWWYAVDDNTYDGPGRLMGWGPTEAEAKDDFWRQWKEKRDSESAAG